MDTFSEIPSEEIKLLTAQFLGQSVLGELKQLNSTIIDGVARPNIDPYKVLESIPSPPPKPVAPPPPALTQQFINQSPVTHVVPTTPPTTIPVPAQQIDQLVSTDENQLEFNFNTSPYTVSIFERLDKIERQISAIINTQADILDILTDKKKPKI